MLSFYLSQHDRGIDDVLADLDGGDVGLASPAGGLRRPDDPLHDGFFDGGKQSNRHRKVVKLMEKHQAGGAAQAGHRSWMCVRT
jgi:hypothetical protein